jgi:hypothetical protein
MAREYIRTIQDLEERYYGRGAGYIQKSDAPVISTTTGVYNAVYGKKVWINLNLEANVWGVLPKKPWDRSGWRCITARASATVTGGVAENGTLPETIKPTWAELSTKPKTMAHNFDASEVMQFLGFIDDSLGDTMAHIREYMSKEHVEHLNKALITQNGTLAGNNLESIDRIIGSYGEITNCTDSADQAYTAGDLDIYTQDRDADVPWNDGYVSHASGTDRTLTLALIDTAFQNIWTNGGNPKVILTGYDTLMRIQQLLQSQQRFMEVKRVAPSINGITGVEGHEAGFMVATYNGVPIIPIKDCVKDTISRIYFIDSDYMWIRVAKPTQYFESGIESGDPFGINRLGQEGMFRTMAEPICSFFKAQGKIRDLK